MMNTSPTIYTAVCRQNALTLSSKIVQESDFSNTAYSLLKNQARSKESLIKNIQYNKITRHYELKVNLRLTLMSKI